MPAGPPSSTPASHQPLSPSSAPQPLADTALPTGRSTAGDPVRVSEVSDQTAASVQGALDALAGQAAKPSTEQIVAALAAAGFAGSGVEVTATSTPTGLEADAVQAAVLHGNECVIGHVREGTVTVTVLPVLASGRCFVGSVLQ